MITRLLTARMAPWLLGAALIGWGIAGTAIWRLAGAGARCDLRIAAAVDAGNNAVRKLAQAQQSALDLIEAEAAAELLRARQAAAARQIERVTVYRDRIVTVDACTVDAERIERLREVLK